MQVYDSFYCIFLKHHTVQFWQMQPGQAFRFYDLWFSAPHGLTDYTNEVVPLLGKGGTTGQTLLLNLVASGNGAVGAPAETGPPRLLATDLCEPCPKEVGGKLSQVPPEAL